MAVAQLVRASGCGPEGRGFESRQPPHNLLFLKIKMTKGIFYLMRSVIPGLVKIGKTRVDQFTN